ncbi:hypothetical protein [Shimia sp.]|uniref:hypothetical protein n=1 Tax=Shimia sp. TaxID=1954381 RepID=UPI00329819B7
MKTDQRAIAAAHNNADWYGAVFAAHRLQFKRLPYAFVGLDTAPPYYSNMTITSPEPWDAILSELARLSARFGGKLGIKDSFCQLDLQTHGFKVLFEASWIWRDPKPSKMPDGWAVVSEATHLELWEDGWRRNGSPTDQRMFPETLLDRKDVCFLGRLDQNRFVAGCIVNRSEGCLGLSNVFSENPTGAQFGDAVNAAASMDERCALVGYESGADLTFAIQNEFQTVGNLRILKAQNAIF